MAVYPDARPWWQGYSREDLGGAGSGPDDGIARLLRLLQGEGKFADDRFSPLRESFLKAQPNIIEMLQRLMGGQPPFPVPGRGGLPGSRAVPMEQDLSKLYMQRRSGGWPF